MPIYEYKCSACEKTGEYIHKMSDPAPTECKLCGKGPLTKKISLSSFALKGAGWYVTDFRGDSNSKSRSSESTESTGSDQSEGTDTKTGSPDSTTSAETSTTKTSESKSSSSSSDSSSSSNSSSNSKSSE